MMKFWPIAATGSNQNNTPSPAPAAPQAPYIAPPLPGFPTPPSPTPSPQGITVVNSTSDSRVLWENGVDAIIFAKDFPAGTGMGRSATRKTIAEAISAPIDPARTTMPGPGSLNDFIRVVLADLLARPVAAGKKPSISPKMFGGRPPPKQMIASGYGSVPKGTVIPDAHFPHLCGVCGGWYYQGTGEHSTPDGLCPKTVKGAQKTRR